jgi:hypothetical protein
LAYSIGELADLLNVDKYVAKLFFDAAKYPMGEIPEIHSIYFSRSDLLSDINYLQILLRPCIFLPSTQIFSVVSLKILI